MDDHEHQEHGHPRGQSDPLRDALTDYMTIPGMKAALLVSDQGLVISGVSDDGVDIATLAALAVDSLQAVQRFGLLVQAGFLNAMRVEFEKLTVVLAPFAPDVMLALVAEAGSFGPLSGDLTPGREAATATAVAARPTSEQSLGRSEVGDRGETP
ncbi:MAG: roadblock/LC7 domain-containing protein [Actinobacteria bacterium]|nr:roadblock/LC7 domain-containing protein [Actinomycetota bacterium]